MISEAEAARRVKEAADLGPRHEGGVLTRRLLSVRLTEASPVSQPGYIQTDMAVRHLAAQVNEDPDEMLALAAAGELRSVFTRTDQQVTAPPTVLPGEGELDLLRRRNALRAKQAGYNNDPATDPGALLLALYRRKLDWDAPVLEDRSQWLRPLS